MSQSSIWINGSSRSGKTTRLIEEWLEWVKAKLNYHRNQKTLSERLQPPASAVLIFAPNRDQRRNLADKLSNAVQGSYPALCKTPIGFFSDEVVLFWPLLLKTLQIKAQFPLRLRPETEQELALLLWRSQIDLEQMQALGGQDRFVRRLLDLWQLAGASCTPIESIPSYLNTGLELPSIINPDVLGKLLLQWRQWCLQRGFLTYGLIYELYWSYLLPDPYYQEQFKHRYEAIFADDVDDYPAIARNLFEFCLDQGKFSVFTYNLSGKIRLGLGADPDYLAGLANRCRVEKLHRHPGIGWQKTKDIIRVVEHPTEIETLKTGTKGIYSLTTVSRAELLRKVTITIGEAISQKKVKPEEIAIIAPGLDEIARYSLMNMLASLGIELDPVNEQRPLYSSPVVRALLNLLALVYPGLGRLVTPEAIAEMLVILSQSQIDPVRAGIISDYCYQVDLEQPYMLPVEKFPRWDRIGYQATQAYQNIAHWITQQQNQIAVNKLSPIIVLNQGIKEFFGDIDSLDYEKLTVLRELTETAQHYWQVDRRLRENDPTFQSSTATVKGFFELLRRGTITANPNPVNKYGERSGKVTLATIFQYRSLRSSHRWHFWLDAGSILWYKGGAAMLFGAPLFWKSWPGSVQTAQEQLNIEQDRLKLILEDLLARVEERIYLCHSDLGVDGREQLGPLLSLVYGSQEC